MSKYNDLAQVKAPMEAETNRNTPLDDMINDAQTVVNTLVQLRYFVNTFKKGRDSLTTVQKRFITRTLNNLNSNEE
jgi:hypothetical protein